MLNGILLLFLIIVLVAIMSHVIPAGEYNSVMIDGKKVIDPDSFHYITSHPASIVDVFLAIPQGDQKAVMLLAMILIIGRCVSVFEQTGAIDGAIAASIRALGTKRKEAIIIFITTFFGLLGAFPAMLESCIPFAPICTAVALTLGYNLLMGIAIACCRCCRRLEFIG